MAAGDFSNVEIEIRQQIDRWVASLEAEANHVSAKRDAALGLRSLTRKSSLNREYIATKGAIPAIVSVLRDSTDPETKKHAVTLLLNLSIHPNVKDEIMAAGALDPIVQVLKYGDCEARANAAAALFSLSTKTTTNKALIGSSTDAIPALVKLLTEGTTRGKKDAASAIFDLAICHENKAIAVRAGVIPPLVDLLLDEKQGIVDEALATLAILATHVEGQAEIGRVGALPLLIDIISESSPQNKENAAAILLELCCSDPNNTYMSAKLGVCGPLGELCSTGTSKARRKARKLLDLQRHAQHRHGHFGARSFCECLQNSIIEYRPSIFKRGTASPSISREELPFAGSINFVSGSGAHRVGLARPRSSASGLCLLARSSTSGNQHYSVSDSLGRDVLEHLQSQFACIVD
nr:U-box domain-containing protein 13-like [Physcomitrium patens]|eukprot:XP_024376671.1 U-box domain-containing protein 13-like [Physcomitrella patens]